MRYLTIIMIIMGLLFMVACDNDASGPGDGFHVLDPTGDGTGTNDALDITGFDVTESGGTIDVTITFNGDVETYNQDSERKFPSAVQFRMKEAGPYPEAYFTEKEKIKVSGGSAEVLSYEFSGNTLTIKLNAQWSLDDVKAVRVSTINNDESKSDGYDD
jgi:hypothetical protein